MCFLCVYMCVCLCASVCAHTQTRGSAEVRLVMALLCLVRTAATVTFTNAMNQRQGGQAGRPKNNQLYSSQIDTGWTGQRERWRRTEHTPRTIIIILIIIVEKETKTHTSDQIELAEPCVYLFLSFFPCLIFFYHWW